MKYDSYRMLQYLKLNKHLKTNFARQSWMLILNMVGFEYSKMYIFPFAIKIKYRNKTTSTS